MAKLKLRAIKDGNDKNRYCGPAVISALTELTTGQAARLIRLKYGRTSIKGTSTKEVLGALKECNINYIPWSKKGVRLNRTHGPTLARWLKLSKEDRTVGRVFLIVAGWHWQLVSGRRYTCGRTREIVSIRDKRVKRRARVAEVYELTSDNVTKPSLDVSKPKYKTSKAYYQIRKLIQKYPQFELSYERLSASPFNAGHEYEVRMSDELEQRAEEIGGDEVCLTYCYDIEEVLDTMQSLARFAKEHFI